MLKRIYQRLVYGKARYNIEISLNESRSKSKLYPYALEAAEKLKGVHHLRAKGILIRGEIGGIEKRLASLDVEENMKGLLQQEEVDCVRTGEVFPVPSIRLNYVGSEKGFSIKPKDDKLYIES